MITDKKILALITARGGSKGLPGKNIKNIAGKPLIAWTIEAALNSKYIDNVIVTTDNNEIADVSKKFGAEIPFIRPAELATDTATSTNVILHALNWVTEHDRYYSFFVLLQPTSPLRTSEHIDKSIEIFFNNKNADSLVSICKISEHPAWMKKINGKGFLENYPTVDEESAERRQNLSALYILNGAIYIMYVDKFIEQKKFEVPNCTYHIMDEYSSVDIDTEFDLLFAEIIKNKLKI